MAEAIPFIGPLIGAGTSLFSGMSSASAANKAAEAQLTGIREGITAQDKRFQQSRMDTSAYRDFGASALRNLAAAMGMPTGDYTDTASGFSLAGLPAGTSMDPYLQPGRPTYGQLAQPYVEGLQPVTNTMAGVMNMFAAPPGASGQPAWYENALAGFKQSPGYQFARGEADKAIRQSTKFQGTGGAAIEAGRQAAGGAAQDFGNYRTNIIDAILSGGKMALGAGTEVASMLGQGLNWASTAVTKEDDRYTNFFNRILSAAGLGNAATTKTAELGAQQGQNELAAYSGMGTAEGRGITNAQTAMNTGLTGATSYLTGPGGPFNANNYASISDPNAYASSSSGIDYGGGSDTGFNSPYPSGYSGVGYI